MRLYIQNGFFVTLSPLCKRNPICNSISISKVQHMLLEIDICFIILPGHMMLQNVTAMSKYTYIDYNMKQA